ncbi:MAG: TraB/GumN family protein [Deltaproteobacteria bacterium]|nr:TraB/GumN family protein [Deltaproteobacteria bacterium]
MSESNNHNMVHRLFLEDREIILIGTAHVSQESSDLVAAVIETERPDTVCVELCASRYQSIRLKDQWQNMDVVKVIKEKKTFLLLSNLILAAFQKRIAAKLDIVPGAEMIRAIEAADATGAAIHLADREIRVTLSRAWKTMTFWEKNKLLYHLLLSFTEAEEISQEDIEKMKEQDVLEALMADVGKTLPMLKRILIEERDQYLAEKIRTAPGRKIVAVVGAGHVAGIKACWNKTIDIAALEVLPPDGRLSAILGWGIPLAIVLMTAVGFFIGGAHVGTNMITGWILTTGILAGIGAAAALAHPLTILSSMLAAPITTLHPLIAAGWVSGLVEAFSRKPKVRDIEALPQDILSVKGFWRNKVTRILLVVVFTNIGASIGTFVAVPLMLRMIH